MSRLFTDTMAERYVTLITREKPFTQSEWADAIATTTFPGGVTPTHAAFRDGSTATRTPEGTWTTTTAPEHE